MYWHHTIYKLYETRYTFIFDFLELEENLIKIYFYFDFFIFINFFDFNFFWANFYKIKIYKNSQTSDESAKWPALILRCANLVYSSAIYLASGFVRVSF